MSADSFQGELLGPMTANQVAGRDFAQRGRLPAARVDRERAAGMEVAAGRRRRGIGDFTGQRHVAARSVGGTGTERMSAAVYGWRGLPKIASVVASSTS